MKATSWLDKFPVEGLPFPAGCGFARGLSSTGRRAPFSPAPLERFAKGGAKPLRDPARKKFVPGCQRTCWWGFTLDGVSFWWFSWFQFWHEEKSSVRQRRDDAYPTLASTRRTAVAVQEGPPRGVATCRSVNARAMA